jgi:hypothetical protein
VAEGRGGRPVDALSGGRSGRGDGRLVEGSADGRQVGGESSVPASLRAYVRRYLERVRGARDGD